MNATSKSLAKEQLPGTAEVQSEPALLNEYKGEITLRLSELPSLKPRVLPTRSRSRWRRFIEAGQRRTFTLSKSFRIEVEGDALPSGLEGCIVIPTVGNPMPEEHDQAPTVKVDGTAQSGNAEVAIEPNVFDGASIPFPWLVSYLSFGVLRPLGILLSASVVHDYAFQFGYLPVIRNGKCRRVPVQRHDADELFRLITQTLNGSNFFSRLAWHAVRLGWWGIKYAGRRFTGKPPIQSTLLGLGSIIAVVSTGVFVRKTLLAQQQSDFIIAAALFGIVAIVVGLVYVWIAIESYFRLPGYYKDSSEAGDNS